MRIQTESPRYFLILILLSEICSCLSEKCNLLPFPQLYECTALCDILYKRLTNTLTYLLH